MSDSDTTFVVAADNIKTSSIDFTVIAIIDIVGMVQMIIIYIKTTIDHRLGAHSCC